VSFAWSLTPPPPPPPAEDASTTPPADAGSTTPASPPEIPSDAPTDVPATEPPSPAAPDTSATDSPVSFLVPVAHADDGSASSAALLKVSYSFDGVSWQEAGQVTKDNWQGFTITIPTTSWDELKNLQVMVETIPTLEERPPVYLESITLKIDTNQTLGEIAGDGLAAVGVLGDSLTQVVTDLVTPDVLAPEPVPVAPPAPAVVTPKAKVDHLSYAFAGSVVQTGKTLPAPRAGISADGLTLTVQGSCTKPYFVVLTYRKVEDYLKSPRSFVSNYADVCTGGLFSYNMDNLPTDTKPGDYYLVTGEQGEEGGWTRTSAFLPVSISSVAVAPAAAP
jgi:hypothetical protein